MVAIWVQINRVTAKLKIIDIKSQKCSVKESKNTKEKRVTGWRVTFDRFWAVENRKPDIELENIRKKLRFTQVKEEDNNNGSNSNSHSLEVGVCVEDEVGLSKFG